MVTGLSIFFANNGPQELFHILCTASALTKILYEPGSKLLVLGMVIQPLIVINPYNRYINPYYWVDDHPLLHGNNGSLDPGSYTYSLGFANLPGCFCWALFGRFMSIHPDPTPPKTDIYGNLRFSPRNEQESHLPKLHGFLVVPCQFVFRGFKHMV